MKIKYLIISMCLLLLTGCKATYTINLDDNFKEEISFGLSQDIIDSEYEFYNNTVALYYDENVEDIDGSLPENTKAYTLKKDASRLYTINSFGSFDNYSKATSVKSCFGSTLVENKYSHKIETDNNNLCFKEHSTLESLEINIVTSNKVVNNNADEINGNTYTWKFTRDNYRLKSIIFEYLTKDQEKDYEKNKANDKKKEKKDIPTPAYVYLLLSLFFGSIFAIIMFRNKKRK